MTREIVGTRREGLSLKGLKRHAVFLRKFRDPKLQQVGSRLLLYILQSSPARSILDLGR